MQPHSAPGLFALFGWVSFIAAHAVADSSKTPLEVSIEQIGNTQIRAKLTNTGAKSLRLLKTGSFLDTLPVEKMHVKADGVHVPFHGIRYQILQTGLGEDAFQNINAQETVQVDLDVAELHDLSAGGEFTVHAEGAFAYAHEGVTELSGHAVGYSSNTLHVNVDGPQAALVKLAVDQLEDRSIISSDCNRTQKVATATACFTCATLAAAAAVQALNGSASKFEEYFKTTNSSARRIVADRLTKVSQECNRIATGQTEYHCTDKYQVCSNNVLAYTVPSKNFVVNCPLYFAALPPITSKCHDQDQATTTLHEMTHAPGVYGPGTLDNAYGYSALQKLDSDKNVNNADTYAVYANAIYVNC